MSPVTIRRTVDFSPDELFEVAANIEAYPKFLPHCVATRVTQRKEGVWLVDNVFSWGPFPIKFRTRAELDAPHGLNIQTIDSLLIDLSLSWRFRALEEGTNIMFEMNLTLPSKGLSRLITPSLRHQVEETERAFLRRAQLLRDTKHGGA
ncbi:MAG: hypothetical protein JKY27_07850 [Magnetovibrio sp.]|nr:hypothetical protein [Magnetovibrio sp.]